KRRAKITIAPAVAALKRAESERTRAMRRGATRMSTRTPEASTALRDAFTGGVLSIATGFGQFPARHGPGDRADCRPASGCDRVNSLRAPCDKAKIAM